MKKEYFDEVRTNLEHRIQECEKHLKGITSNSLRKKSLDEVIMLRDFCKKEMPEMDAIVHSELYHILGMGNLTARQQSTFIKLMKEYMSYRSDMKTICYNLNNFDHIPNLPSSSSYKLSKLATFTLHSDFRVDYDDVPLEEANADKSIILEENKLTIKKSSLDEYVEMLGKKSGITKQGILGHALNHIAYGNVIYSLDKDCIIGEILHESTLNKLKKVL